MKKDNTYWTSETNDYIFQYNELIKLEKYIDANKIYTSHIHNALSRLSEYWVNSYKIPNLYKEELITELYRCLHYYQKGKNGFAYFGTIAKLYLYNVKKKNIKRENRDDEYSKNIIENGISANYIIDMDLFNNLSEKSKIDFLSFYERVKETNVENINSKFFWVNDKRIKNEIMKGLKKEMGKNLIIFKNIIKVEIKNEYI